MRYRASMHCGKKSEKGNPYNPKHNDREFDEERKIYAELCGNETLKFSFDEQKSFDRQEAEFYKQHFSKSLENKNEKYRSKSYFDKIKTMEQYRKSAKTCPDETIFQIGNQEIGYVPNHVLVKIVLEQIEWETKTFPQVEYLNFALHLDKTETDEYAPHIHCRKVFIAHDENGNEEINATKALKEMGIGTDLEGTRYNNSKREYTRLCREHYEEVCRKYGIELEPERLPKRKHSSTFTEEEKKRLAELKEEKQKLKKKITEVNNVAENFKQRIEQAIEKAKQIGYKEGYKRCLEDIENAKKKSKKNEYTR